MFDLLASKRAPGLPASAEHTVVNAALTSVLRAQQPPTNTQVWMPVRVSPSQSFVKKSTYKVTVQRDHLRMYLNIERKPNLSEI